MDEGEKEKQQQQQQAAVRGSQVERSRVSGTLGGILTSAIDDGTPCYQQQQLSSNTTPRHSCVLPVMSLKEVKPEAATNESTSSAAVQASTASAASRVLPLAASLQSNLHLLLARLGKLLKFQALLRSKICNGTATPQQLGLLPGWSDLASAAQKWQRDVEALNRWVVSAGAFFAFQTRSSKPIMP